MGVYNFAFLAELNTLPFVPSLEGGEMKVQEFVRWILRTARATVFLRGFLAIGCFQETITVVAIGF